VITNVTWQGLIEILLLSLLFYTVLAFLKGSRGAGIVRGVGAVLGVAVIVFLSMTNLVKGFYVLEWLLTNVLGYAVIALIVIFQPELRSALVRVGQNPLFTSFIKEGWNASSEIVEAATALAREHIGAIIAVQRNVGLKAYTDGGIQLDAEVSAELLVSIFKGHNPLHDGAVVIRGNRVVAAACLFPLSENPNLDTSLGTRHRAALGLSEESDAIVVVVSEETGDISIAERGSLMRKVDEKLLRATLRDISSTEGFETAATASKELA
jgi:diadenylate cyclase